LGNGEEVAKKQSKQTDGVPEQKLEMSDPAVTNIDGDLSTLSIQEIIDAGAPIKFGRADARN
jgi:hypothetical protein